MSTRLRSAAVVSLVATVMALSGCGGDGGSTSSGGSAAKASSGGSATITIDLPPLATTTCAKVTDDRGIFKKHGITIKYGTPAPTGSAEVAKVLNGQVDVGMGSYTAVITAVSNNLSMVITNSMELDYDKGGKTPLGVVVGKDSDITSFKQLEGKTIGVNSLKSSWEVLLKEAVSKDGGDPSKVKLVSVPFADQVTAVKSGRVDAVFTTQPFQGQLLSQGYTSIGDPQAISFDKPDSVTNVAFMSKKFVDANPDAAKNFVAALQEGNEWCNAHPDDMKKSIADFTKVSQSVIDQAPTPVYDARIDSAETDTWSRLLVKYGIIKKAPSAEEVQWTGVLTG